MTPDKNTTSDNAADQSVEDAQDNVVSIERDGSPDAKDPGSATHTQADQSEHSQDAAGNTSPQPDTALEGELVDKSDTANSEGSEDPLGFGDQRMGEDAEPLDEMGELRAMLADAESRATENWDRLLRLQADMENQRKRAQNDVTKARKFALEGIVSDLLPVKDSLEMGLAAAQAEDADPQSIIEGAELTLKMLAQVFEKNNIAEVNPVDEKFDPEFHQAMSMQEIEGKAPNTVASVMQKGYTLNERLVRPALVMVAK